jgi:hypothetical protein
MTAMNINNLEKLVRQALKGDNAGEKSNTMLNSRGISSIEHKSFNQMTFQMSDMNNGAGAGTVALRILPTPPTWI